MSFIIKYRPFINLIFKENNGGRLTNFSCFPTVRCRQLMSQHRILFRSRSAGFQLYFSEVPFVDIDTRLQFSFGFRSAVSGVLKKYGLVRDGEDDQSVYYPGLYFNNLNPGGTVKTGTSRRPLSSSATVSADDTYRLYSQTFSVSDRPAPGFPSSYTLSNRLQPAQQQTVAVAAANGDAYVTTTINSPGQKEEYFSEPGPYLLKADTDTPPDRRIYLDSELSRSESIGAIELYWDSSLQPFIDEDRQQRYKITFNPI